MLDKEDWMEIKAQIAKGVYRKDIARQLGVHPKTVSRALQRGGPPRRKSSGRFAESAIRFQVEDRHKLHLS